MSRETFRDQLSRVEQMAADDNNETWDLSESDQAALAAVLADRQRLAEKLNTRLDEIERLTLIPVARPPSGGAACPTCQGRRWIMRTEHRDLGHGQGAGAAWNEPCPDCARTTPAPPAPTEAPDYDEVDTSTARSLNVGMPCESNLPLASVLDAENRKDASQSLGVGTGTCAVGARRMPNTNGKCLTEAPTRPAGKYRDRLLGAAYTLAGRIRRGKDGTLAFLDVVDTIFEEMEAPVPDLEALVEKWRKRADATEEGKVGLSWAHGCRLTDRACADELEAALRRGGPEGVEV